MAKKFNLPNFIMSFIVLLFALCCLLPMILLIMVSITEEAMIVRYGYQFIPKAISFEAYTMMFKSGTTVIRSYGVSVTVTVVGTIMAVLLSSMAAFTLANKNVRYRNHLAFFFFFTMLFGAGIVPWYIVCRSLGLINNIFALIVPSLMFSSFNMFLVRNYMLGIPDSLMESAKLDGANELQIAFKIYFPLSVPVLATITLFHALAYWNDWWNAIMLIDNQRLFPLQYLLFKLQSEMQMLRDLQIATAASSGIKPPTESLKMATVVVTIGPIVLLYPFLQRYFIKGLVIGGIKG